MQLNDPAGSAFLCAIRSIPRHLFVLRFKKSLAGHTAAVEAVQFDGNDQVIVAGSSSGTLKLWDIERSKCKPVAFYYPLPSSCLSALCAIVGSLRPFFPAPQW